MSFRSGFVSIIGRPNVGKSTLLNRIVGEKIAIVSDKPQTTRNRIQGIKTTADSQIVFIDTPGIHKPIYRMNQYMLKTALGSLVGMDLVLMMVDVTQPPGKGDEFVIKQLPKEGAKVFLLINKIDLIKKNLILPAIDFYKKLFDFEEIFPISAFNGDNVDSLEAAIVSCLSEGPKYFEENIITDRTERFFAAEVVREKLLKETRDELPYSSAVVIEQWEEHEDVIRIHALIYVDKPSHKPIVIGTKGERLKKIGTNARLELEDIFGTKVFLNTWVKVRENWRDSDRMLREMGLRETE